VNWEALVELGRELPGVELGTSYGTPALKVRGKLVARLKDDGETVVFMLESVDEQEFLIETQPGLYFITDHYRGWASVLARLSALRAGECRERLEEAWRLKAPRTLIDRHEEARAPRASRAPRPREGKRARAR
jgi:hypothetical protein